MNGPALPSGRQVRLRAGRCAAVVVESGATLRSLTREGRPLLAGFAEDAMASSGRGQVLMPWPNRIEDGRYDFAGTRNQLPLSEPAKHNASHGLVRWQSWRLEQLDESAVAAHLHLLPSPGYPFDLQLRVEYALHDRGLTVTATTTNLGAQEAPYGHGFHPYLCSGAGPVDEWTLQLPARRMCRVDHRGLPGAAEPVDAEHDFTAARRIGSLQLDNPFTDLVRDTDGLARVRVTGPGAAPVTLWLDEHHRWVQVFTGDQLPDRAARQALAVEPMTCPPNAFRSGTDLMRLAPSQVRTARWGITSG
ncbi:MAG: aldose 1-epimerase family protein [Nocardioidaceae bacterium]